jgi:hypothetical protein
LADILVIRSRMTPEQQAKFDRIKFQDEPEKKWSEQRWAAFAKRCPRWAQVILGIGVLITIAVQMEWHKPLIDGFNTHVGNPGAALARLIWPSPSPPPGGKAKSDGGSKPVAIVPGGGKPVGEKPSRAIASDVPAPDRPAHGK